MIYPNRHFIRHRTDIVSVEISRLTRIEDETVTWFVPPDTAVTRPVFLIVAMLSLELLQISQALVITFLSLSSSVAVIEAVSPTEVSTILFDDRVIVVGFSRYLILTSECSGCPMLLCPATDLLAAQIVF